MGNEGDVVFQIYHLWKTTSPNFMDLKLLYQPADMCLTNEANSKRKIENRSINGEVIAIFNLDHEIARLDLWVKREPTFDILSFAQFLSYRNRSHHFRIVRSSGTNFKSYNISKFWR